MLQYKVPQNVQAEDKIVSFLTMRQLIICIVGGGMAYVIYLILAQNYYAEVWLPPVFVVVALTAAVAFLKINDIKFTKWVLLIVEFMANPRKRVWDKTETAGLFFTFVTSKTATQSGAQKKNKKNNKTMKDLSVLDEITKNLDKNPFGNVDIRNDQINVSVEEDPAHASLVAVEETSQVKTTEDIKGVRQVPQQTQSTKVEKKKSSITELSAKPLAQGKDDDLNALIGKAVLNNKIKAVPKQIAIADKSVARPGDAKANFMKNKTQKRNSKIHVARLTQDQTKRTEPVRQKQVDTQQKLSVSEDHKEQLNIVKKDE